MSQQHSQTKKIGGHSYEVFHLDSETGWAYVVKIDRMLMPIIGQLVESTQHQGKGLGAVVPFARIGQYLADNLDAVTIKQLTDDLISVTHVDGKPLKDVYKLHFRGRLGDHHVWFMWAAQVQFADFFSKLKGDFADSIREGQGKVSQFLRTSAGPSGESS